MRMYVRKRVYILIHAYMRLRRTLFVDESLDLCHQN
jgi:hypothetical protein